VACGFIFQIEGASVDTDEEVLTCIKCGGFWNGDTMDPHCINCGHRPAIVTATEAIMEANPKRKPGRPKKEKEAFPVGLEPDLQFDDLEELVRVKKEGVDSIPEPKEERRYPQPVESLRIEDQPFVLFLAEKWEALDQEIEQLMVPIQKKKSEQAYLCQLTEDYGKHLEAISQVSNPES